NGMAGAGGRLGVRKNGRVAIAGRGSALGGYPAVSASCPATGAGAAPGSWMRSPVPTLNVSDAVSGRHAVTVGLIPRAYRLARPGALIAACHPASPWPRPAAAKGAAKPPEARAETARPRTTSEEHT